MKTTSFKSPKNKFRASITYSKALTEIGSSSSATANSVDDLKAYIQHYIDQAHNNSAKCTIVISENKSEYPLFNWVEIEKYED